MAVDPSAAPRPRRAAARPFYGWVVVAAVFCILALAYVIWYSFGLFLVALVTAMGWVSGVALVGRWFSRRMGLALGIIGAGIGLGTFIGAPPIQLLIETYGWRTAYVVLAVVLALAPQPLALLLRARPEDLGL